MNTNDNSSSHSPNDYFVYALGCLVLDLLVLFLFGSWDGSTLFGPRFWIFFVCLLPASFNGVVVLTLRSGGECSQAGVLLFVGLTIAIGLLNHWLIETIAAAV